MAKSINFKAFKGYPFTIKATGKGYFDFSNSYFKNQNSDLNLDSEIKPYSLNDYGSVKFVEPSQSAATIISEASMTPNCMSLNENRSVMLPFRGEKYYDVGYKEPLYINNGCIISDNNIVTGFSETNKISIDKTFPSNVTTASILTKANFFNKDSHNCLFGRNNRSGISIIVRNFDSKFIFACWTNVWHWNSETPVIELNKDYWFKVVWDGTNLTGYMLADDLYTKDTLPELDSWTQCWQNQVNIFNDAKFDIGYAYYSTSEYLKGSLDLGNTEIMVNDDLFWNMNSSKLESTDCYGNLYDYIDTGAEKTLGCWFAERNSDKERFLLLTDKAKLSIGGYTTRWLADKTIPAHDVYDYSETVVQGGVNKSYTLNGGTLADKKDAVTNFGSASNYVSLDCAFPENAGLWEFVTHVKFVGSVGDSRFLVSDQTNSSGHFGIALGTNSSGYVWVFLSSTGDNYNITSATTGSTHFEADKDYWVKLQFTGTQYSVYVSTTPNFIETPEITIESTEHVFTNGADMVIGIHGDVTSPTNMVQYLRDTYLKTNGNKMLWKLQYSVPHWSKK